MGFIEDIESFSPINKQEENDKRLILNFAKEHGHNVLTRENEIAHITSSGFLLNPKQDKTLMIFHNIYQNWAWTGGHADGDGDLLKVALKEAKEETGIMNPVPLFDEIASIDILPVYGHFKNGKYVSCHLHLSVAYILICADDEIVRPKTDENSNVKWIDICEIKAGEVFSENNAYLYNKLIERAEAFKRLKPS